MKILGLSHAILPNTKNTNGKSSLFREFPAVCQPINTTISSLLVRGRFSNRITYFISSWHTCRFRENRKSPPAESSKSFNLITEHWVEEIPTFSCDSRFCARIFRIFFLFVFATNLNPMSKFNNPCLSTFLRFAHPTNRSFVCLSSKTLLLFPRF